MRRLANVALLAALAGESASVVSLLGGGGGPALMLHLVASACAAALLHRRILAGSAGWSFALLFAVHLFVPLLGVGGVIAIALASPRSLLTRDPECVETRIPRMPERAREEDSPDTAPGAGACGARIAALAALRGRSDPEAIALLRRALGDDEEHVRLLGHALLEAKNREACRQIDTVTRELDEAPDDRRGLLRGRLAFQHWELAWSGLVQGECLDHALKTAREHAIRALERHPHSAPLLFLLGRIELRLRQPERAEPALTRARELGLPASVAGPYLAEAAFLRRRFDLVAANLLPCGNASAAAARLRRYWT